MTSGQKIILDDLNNFPMNSYGTSITSTELSNVTSIFEKPISHDYTSPSEQDKRTFGT
jgi:hypothetical protein